MHRLILESLDYPNNCCFVTLTYRDEIRDLRPVDLQLWLKRLQFRKAPETLRYFAVGEYGDNSWRPHYHAALFGVAPCAGGPIIKGECQCVTCLDVRETWGYGHVLVGNLEPKSAQYICGYVTKKMTHREDPRLLEREPEFARMSLRPGIGANALWNVASEIMRYSLEKRVLPGQLRHGDLKYPMGRYLRKKLGKMCGLDDEQMAAQTDLALSVAYEELSLVRKVAWATDKAVREVYAELNGGYEAKLEGRLKLKRRVM